VAAITMFLRQNERYDLLTLSTVIVDVVHFVCGLFERVEASLCRFFKWFFKYLYWRYISTY